MVLRGGPPPGPVRAQGARVQQLQAEGFRELQGQLAATVGGIPLLGVRAEGD